VKLKLVNQYIIPFTGLKEGDHRFTFNFRKEFFDSYEVLEAQDGNIEAAVLLNKKPSMLTVAISMHGFLDLQCDRCLDNFRLPIDYRGTLVIKFDENTAASTDDIWILHPNETDLDLEQYFYECIGLCIPIQRTHPDNIDGSSGCNPVMIDLIESHNHPEKKQDEPDPRWNKLKDLLNDINNN
jgi:uncharacterized protein